MRAEAEPLPSEGGSAPKAEAPRAAPPPNPWPHELTAGELAAAPTAIMPAVGPACAACNKANHPGVPQCVFCGTLYSAPAVTLAAPSATIAGARTAWCEGPLAVQTEGAASESMRTVSIERPISDRPPASRRAFQDSDSDDMLSPPVADPLIGVVVAERYRILEPLGRGGMGIVYKVEHSRIGKLLAMKLLTGELSRNREVVRRFKQEALTASRLSSPNTVQVFDFGASEGLTYLVMELVAGEDLARTLRTFGPMPFERLGKVLIQVCTSLAEAHQKGIIHRDVKPENVMLTHTRDGADVVKVLDFGLAKLREGADLNDVTSQGAIVGTPYFMSPEQIRGEQVDPRTDIYALGALMYRALTGHYPFNGPTPMAVFTKHLTEPVIPPLERAPELGIPLGVSAVVLKALAKNPTDRFQRVEDLQTALVDEMRATGISSLETLLDSGKLRGLAQAEVAVSTAAPVEIATRDEVERYERKLRRMRWGTLGALGVLVAGAAAGGVKLFYHERDALHRGHELEPNDTPAEATALPFGTSVTGHLGRRLDPTRGDRDFYAVDVPVSSPPTHPDPPNPPAQPVTMGATVKLSVTALPNFPMCTLLYRRGFDSAVGQYCVGRPARDLSIPALRLEPGRYFVAILQDLDPYGSPAPPFIHENVSDAYTVTIGASSPGPREEVEPNDHFASANPILPGVPMTGALGWIHDVDVFCLAAAPQTPGPIRWKVRDAGRDVGTVLEVTPMTGPLEGAPVRVHTAAGKASATDVESPWRSPPIAESSDDATRCLRVRLTNDPWARGATDLVPAAGPESYVIEVEAP